MADPRPQLLTEFDEALTAFQRQGQRLADLTERVTWARLRGALPTASVAEVEGSFNEDWLRVLRFDGSSMPTVRCSSTPPRAPTGVSRKRSTRSVPSTSISSST